MDCRAVLDGIRDRLTAREPPQDIIESLVPRTPAEAEAWGRRLPLWAEFTPEYGDQAVALARVVSKRGLRRHRRTLDRDGQIIPGTGFCDLYRPPPGRPVAFTVAMEGVPVRVEYTPSYTRGHDHFQFTGPGDPPAAIPFTGSAHWSLFAPGDAVAAVGGAEAFVHTYVAAGAERDRLFRATFEGDFPKEAKPVKGKHTAKEVERSAPPNSPPPDESDGTPSLF